MLKGLEIQKSTLNLRFMSIFPGFSDFHIYLLNTSFHFQCLSSLYNCRLNILRGTWSFGPTLPHKHTLMKFDKNAIELISVQKIYKVVVNVALSNKIYVGSYKLISK